jgi:membrane-bound serine protease (ClpP class)
MIGSVAIVRTSLTPVGQVEIRGELWQARLLNPSSSSSPSPGDSVHVRAVQDLVLIVDP